MGAVARMVAEAGRRQAPSAHRRLPWPWPRPSGFVKNFLDLGHGLCGRRHARSYLVPFAASANGKPCGAPQRNSGRQGKKTALRPAGPRDVDPAVCVAASIPLTGPAQAMWIGMLPSQNQSPCQAQLYPPTNRAFARKQPAVSHLKTSIPKSKSKTLTLCHYLQLDRRRWAPWSPSRGLLRRAAAAGSRWSCAALCRRQSLRRYSNRRRRLREEECRRFPAAAAGSSTSCAPASGQQSLFRARQRRRLRESECRRFLAAADARRTHLWPTG